MTAVEYGYVVQGTNVPTGRTVWYRPQDRTGNVRASSPTDATFYKSVTQAQRTVDRANAKHSWNDKDWHVVPATRAVDNGRWVTTVHPDYQGESS
jgi:hypothetical protein